MRGTRVRTCSGGFGHTHPVRHTEFWARMERALGRAYARSWADQHVMSELGERTATEALEAGVPPLTVWRTVWSELGLPGTDR